MGGEVLAAGTGVEAKRRRTGLRAPAEPGAVDGDHREGVVVVCPAKIQRGRLRRTIGCRNSGRNPGEVGEPRPRNGGFPREEIPPLQEWLLPN